MRKSRLTYTSDGDDDNALSGQVQSDGKASGINVFVSGHNSDISDFEQPDTDHKRKPKHKLAEVNLWSIPMNGLVPWQKTTQIRMKWTFLSQMKLHNNPFRSQWSVQLLYMNDVVALIQTVVTMPIKRSRIILYVVRWTHVA